jgi:hypothetical protein
MKGIQNKKFIFWKLIIIRFMSSERKLWKVFLLARFTRMHQLATSSEISNDVDTTGTGSMPVVAGRAAVSYGCPASL